MPNARTWVDFRHVRETVGFGAVLEAYGVRLKLRGEHQHQGFCPLPSHEGAGRSPSFSAHLAKKAFHCFGCQASGNAIDFVALMEGLNPDDPRDIRRAALLIQERFLHGSPGPAGGTGAEAAPEPRQNGRPESRRSRFQRRTRGRVATEARGAPKPATPDLEVGLDALPQTATAPESGNQPRVINAPLSFELKGLDPDHPYLAQRGLTPETIRTFGLGYCSRGIMAGRIAIPLHDLEGRLIGYAGRLVEDSAAHPENPKYRLPGTRERDGTRIEFSSGAFLFNSHRIGGPVEDLIIVEGFFSVFHLHQHGWKNAVALMGSSLSEEQAEMICRLTHFDSRVWVMTDGDEAGERCAREILAAIAPERFVRWVALERGEQPHGCSPDRLHELLDLPVR